MESTRTISKPCAAAGVTKRKLLIFFVIVFIGGCYNIYFQIAQTNRLNNGVNKDHDTSTTSNSSTAIRPPLVEESANKRNKKFISYELVKDLPLRAVYDIMENDQLSCHDESGFLPEPFQAPGLLDFSTLIDTNLNILYVGDSVGVQFTQILQEATHPIKRETIRYAWKAPHENSHIALTPSGGTVAGTRVTGLMTNTSRNVHRWLPNSAGGGWLTRDVREMKRLNRHWRPTETVSYKFGRGRSPCEEGEVEGAENATFPSKEEYPCEEQDFDVVVHQFAPGWQPNFVKGISWSAIDEMVNLSFDYLGANTVVLQTIQIMNNVENITELIEVNSVIWKYARDFQAKEAQRKSKDGRKRRVVVMDLYAYTVSLVLQNSMAIGLVSNDRGATLQRQLQESNDFDTYLNLTMSLDDIYQRKTQIHFKTAGGIEMFKKQSHICADANCDKKSRITADGQHWCTKSTGGRINAALACLLRCSFGEEAKADKTAKEMKQCEWRCNKKYMSLAPLPWDNAEEIEVNFNMVDLTNKKLRIQNNSIALRNY
mmetsp:Transcript_3185/g.4904  ORF Transcript_3185/g.4904 Transcript_3185/m.4904 type:complete len:542 (-) Transcript_3185:80-1705(-)